MAEDQETLELTTPLPTGQDMIKTQISFKKGIIAGILVVILVLGIGVLIGYGCAQTILTNYYSQKMAEQAAKCIILG